MSITFCVYPLRKQLPTFREVLNLSNRKFNSFLRENSLNFDKEINIKLLTKEDDSEQILDLDSLAKWNEDSYAWFTISEVFGGIDAYYWELNEQEKADNLEELLSYELAENRRLLVSNCLENQLEWNFRKSAGQLCITALAFGFVASSFAELTGGIIYSGDGGWDYQIFPATSEEFDAVYFRPERALSEEKRDWAINCIENIF